MSNIDKTEKQGETKDVTVHFNGRSKLLEKNSEITFNDAISYAFAQPPTGDNLQFTVQYTKGHSDKPKGSLVEGQSVKAKDGMEFDVTPTNRS
jgi:hypothetical protein